MGGMWLPRDCDIAGDGGHTPKRVSYLKGCNMKARKPTGDIV